MLILILYININYVGYKTIVATNPLFCVTIFYIRKVMASIDSSFVNNYRRYFI